MSSQAARLARRLSQRQELKQQRIAIAQGRGVTNEIMRLLGRRFFGRFKWLLFGR